MKTRVLQQVASGPLDLRRENDGHGGFDGDLNRDISVFDLGNDNLSELDKIGRCRLGPLLAVQSSQIQKVRDHGLHSIGLSHDVVGHCSDSGVRLVEAAHLGDCTNSREWRTQFV